MNDRMGVDAAAKLLARVAPQPAIARAAATAQNLHDVCAKGRGSMFNHVMVGSNDLDRSKRFYDAVLGILGAGEAIRNEASSGHNRLIYRHAGSMFGVSEPINDDVATAGNGSTIAFRCQSPEQVQAFHDVAVANGGTSIEDAPGPRNTSVGRAHLAYVRDPDGNKLCAVYRG